ncbi:MAG: hypothetical protein ACYSW8_32905 [Planctomycetota bacterium]
MAKMSDVRNKHLPMHFVVHFECEETRQFELTEEALLCLEKNGLVEEVDPTLGLTRQKWKAARQPKSSGTTWGFNNLAQTINKKQL